MGCYDIPVRFCRTLLVLLVIIAVAASACGRGGDRDEAQSPPEPELTTSTTAPDELVAGDDDAEESTTTSAAAPVGPRAPLTGLPWNPALDRDRPALLVKIDNIEGLARPQTGLSAADIVVEEMIEGASTRFAAVFHSDDTAFGPIRSGRSTDVALIHALNRPGLIMTGANRIMLEQLLDSPILDYTRDGIPENYDRRDDRRSPDDFYSSTDRFWAEITEGSKAPPQWFRYRLADLPDGEVAPGAETATPTQGMSMDWGTGAGAGPVRYDWNELSASWDRTQNDDPHVEEDGTRISPTNVIIQFVEYRDTGLVDPAGSPVPEAMLLGEGEMWAFVGGEVMQGTWQRSELSKLTRWLDENGRDITINPGQTFIELVSPGKAAIDS